MWVTDKVKGLVLTLVMGLPLCMVLEKVMVAAEGTRVWFWLWLVLAVFMVIMIFAYPRIIAPLFNTFTRVEEDSDLGSAICELARRAEYPLAELYVMDGSKRSSHSNAYMYGFGKAKRIVLFDSLVEQLEIPQVVAVLAHEIGHYTLSHTLIGIVASQAYVFVFLYAFATLQSSFPLASGLLEAHGFPQASPHLILLLLFSLYATPLDLAVSLAMNAMSRSFEYAADRYAAEIDSAESLVTALEVIQRENMGIDDPDEWYSLYHHTHPPIPHRVRALRRFRKLRKYGPRKED